MLQPVLDTPHHNLSTHPQSQSILLLRLFTQPRGSHTTTTQLLGLSSHLPGKATIITQQPDQNTPVLGALMTTILHCGQSSRHPECPMTITHLHDQATAQ